MSKNDVRSIGICVLVFNLWLIGRYSLGPIATLVLTFGAFSYTHLVAMKELFYDHISLGLRHCIDLVSTIASPAHRFPDRSGNADVLSLSLIHI